MRRLILGFACVAAPVAAQNSTTTCYRAGSLVNCDTRTQSTQSSAAADAMINDLLHGGENFSRAYEQGQRNYEEQQLRQQQIELQRQAFAAEQQRQQMVRRVGGLIAEGKCPEAKALASFSGDYVLIGRMGQACP